MSNSTVIRATLSVSVAAILAACGGSQTFSAAPTLADLQALPHHKTFHYTGEPQTFKVPAGVKWLTVVALGAGGGGSTGAHGGRVYAELPVLPGQRLSIFVGGAANGLEGGYNGGGQGVYGSVSSYGGGGATDIRSGGRILRDRILVVGGGGGEGAFEYAIHGYRGGDGGKGGGSTAGDGAHGSGRKAGSGGHTYGTGGAGGTQVAGGTGGQGGSGGYGDGKDGFSGSFGVGGSGGEGVGFSGGGGGGGGYYGGGGGGGGGYDYGGYDGGGGGGGGGSSYVEPSARKYESWKGWQTAKGDGLLVLGW